MNFTQAKPITNKMFAQLSPVNVFHREMEETGYKPEQKYQNQHILFRKKFCIENMERTTIKITADDYYKLYVNGTFVVQGPAPSYHFAYYYNEVDLTQYLHEGENVIAIHTYYQGLINRVWVSGDLCHMLIAEVMQGEQVVCATDESWKNHIHTAFYDCKKKIGYDTGFAEGYDAGAKEVGFEELTFDDSDWALSEVNKGDYYTFLPQPTKVLDIYRVKPRSMVKTKYGYAIDLGQEMVCYLTFTAKGGRGDKVIIRAGEELLEDGHVRYDMRCNCYYEEEFLLGDQVSTYVQYDYKAFRYVELHIPQGTSIDEESFEIIVRHYPFEAAITCPSEDEVVQRIWDLCANTIKYGMQEVLVDCPTREKGQYLGDATITAISHALLTGNADFLKKTLWDFAHTSFISKGIMSVSSCSFMQEIADYSLQFPLQVLWCYHYTGDVEFLRSMQPYVQNVCEDFRVYAGEGGLIEGVIEQWNLVDWPANLRDNYDFALTKPIGKGYHNVINAFYYGAVKALEEIDTILDIDYETNAESIKQAFIKAFYSEETQLFVDAKGSTHSSLHANVLPLLFGITCGNETEIITFLDEKGIDTCGVYMAMFYLFALKNAGREDLMYKQLTSKFAWKKMLNQGATTCFEAWGKEDNVNCSLFHPWATGPIMVLSETKFPF